MVPCLCVHRLVLLAYDADKDNTPCLLGGSRAHWALIRGLALPPPCEAAQRMLVAAHASQQEADIDVGPSCSMLHDARSCVKRQTITHDPTSCSIVGCQEADNTLDDPTSCTCVNRLGPQCQEADNHVGPECHAPCHLLASAHDGTAHDGSAHDSARDDAGIATAHIASGGARSASGGGGRCTKTRRCLDVALEWCCADVAVEGSCAGAKACPCAGAKASLPRSCCSCWWCNDTCLGLRRHHAQEGCGEWEGIVALCVHGKVCRMSLQ